MNSSTVIALLAFGLVACLSAGDVDGDPLAKQPVVVVNGETITLRHLEDEMLQQEGVDLMMDLVQQSLKKLEWSKLKTDATLVTVGHFRITRGVLAAELLRQNAAKVRTDMINILLVEQALRREGILLTDLVLDHEIKRLEDRFRHELVERKQPMIAFEDYLQQSEGLTVAEFRQQSAFRMLAGLHLLVFRKTQIPEDDLKRFFHDHPERFNRDEQLDLSLLTIPFEERARTDPMAKEGPRSVLAFIYQQILAGKTTFTEQFKNFGRGHDPEADDAGRIGWVGPDGRRGAVGSRTLPKYLMQALLATNREKLPVLVKPLETEDGVYLFAIHGHRGAVHPKYEEVVEQVRETYIEENLKDATDRLLRQLRKDATIEFKDLPPLIRSREAQVDAGKRQDEAVPDEPTAEPPTAPPAEVPTP